MARNKLTDLNNHLFAQLERLEDEDLKPKQLENEIKRANAISNVARNIIGNARLTLEAVKIQKKVLPLNKQLPSVFNHEN